MNGERNGPVDARRLVWPGAAILGFITLMATAIWSFSRMQTGQETVLRALQERPTASDMKATILETVGPLRESMVEIRTKLDALSEKVQRIERDDNK